MKKTTLQDRITVLAYQAGSLNKLSDDLGIDLGYLSRLRKGEKTNPSDEVLAKLGLLRIVTYYLDEDPQ